MSLNLMASLADLANLKQLDKDKLAEIIQDGLYQAVSKKLLSENELEIVTDFDRNIILARFKKIVVDQDFSLGEISLEEALRYEENVSLGDKITVEIPIFDFEPKVIKNARKAILERIKILEEDRIMFDYENQKNQLVSGKIRKEDYNGYILDIGYADALLPKEEQIEEEYYKVGDIVRAYVVNIRKRKNDVIIILSRTRPEFVKRIFETEIPEINSGEVEIKKIVREPGMRTKVAVISKDPNLDATACCLGPRGVRIEQIRNELNGELIDIVLWDDLDSTKYPNIDDRYSAIKNGKDNWPILWACEIKYASNIAIERTNLHEVKRWFREGKEEKSFNWDMDKMSTLVTYGEKSVPYFGTQYACVLNLVKICAPGNGLCWDTEFKREKGKLWMLHAYLPENEFFKQRIQ